MISIPISTASPESTIHKAIKEFEEYIKFQIGVHQKTRLGLSLEPYDKKFEVLDDECLSDRVDHVLRSLLDDSLTLQTNSQESPSLIEPNVDQNNDQNINLNPTSSHNQIKSPDREVPKVSGSENDDSENNPPNLKQDSKKQKKVIETSKSLEPVTCSHSSKKRPRLSTQRSEINTPKKPISDEQCCKKIKFCESSSKNLQSPEVEAKELPNKYIPVFKKAEITRPKTSTNNKTTLEKKSVENISQLKVKESSSQKSVDSRQTPKTIAEENDTKLSSKKGHKQYITQTSVKKTGQSAPAGSNANIQNHVNNPKLATFAKPGVPVTKLPKIPKLLKTSSLCNVTPSNSNFSVLLKSPNKKEIESESKRETIAKSVHSNKLHEENVSCKSAAVAPEIIKNKNQITFNVTAAKIRKIFSTDNLSDTSASPSDRKLFISHNSNLTPYQKIIMEAIKQAERTKNMPESIIKELPSPMQVFTDLEEYKSNLIPLLTEDLSRNISNMYYMYDNINHNKFQSANIIKIEEQSDTTIVIARYVENPLNQKLKIGDFALITYINQRNKNADHFVAYIENVQKPDMKYHDKDDKDFYSTVTFNTPWTNLPIRKLLKIRFQFCVDTDDIQKSLKSIYKLNSDDLLTKFVLNPNNIKQLPPPLNEYTGNDDLNEEQNNIVMKLANDNCFNIESGQISVIDGCPGSGKSLIMIKNIVVETFRQALSHSESPPLRILVCLKRYNKHIKMSLMDGRAESQINFKILITFFKLKKKGTLINQTTPKFQVVVSSCYCKWQPFEKYDIVIVDGATQFSEADMAVLLSYKPSKLILIDDSKQLNLNVPDKDLGRAIYSVSFMDRVLSCHTEKNKSPICHLSIQHRMHPAILHFPNAEFYSNSIRTHPSVLYRHFPLNPYGMFNLHTQDLRATIDNFRFDFLEKLLETIYCIMGETMCSIGVITTSTSDMAEIKLRSQINLNLQDVFVDSMEKNSVAEKDIIILFVANTDEKKLLLERRRMNFALTRARHSLWICGNFNSIRETFFWTNLMNNASKRDRYHKINEHNFEMVDQILRNTGVTDGDRNLKRKH